MGSSGEMAHKRLSVADHILTQTYPLVKDPKLLVAVLQNLVDALDAGVTGALETEIAQKRLVAMPANAQQRLGAFHAASSRHGVDAAFFRFTEELRETLSEHQSAPIEFVRKEKLVICDEKYKVRTLSEETLKGELQQARRYLDAIAKVN